MATYVNDLRLKEIGTGESSGTWGTETNVNLELIGEAMGYATKAVADASTSTITMPDGTATNGELRSLYLKLTGGGQASTVTLAPNTVSKVWFIENATSYTLTFTQGSGANVAVLAGQTKSIASDGAGSGAALYDVLTDLSVAGDFFVASTIQPAGDTASGDAAAIGYASADGIIVTGQGSTSDVTLKNDADGTVLTIPTGTTNVDIVGVATAATFEPDGDTAAGDNAAIGYTAAEGLILTGQGSTNDVTIKNDADADVIEIPTGTTTVNFAGAVDVVGDLTAATFTPDGDTAAGDTAAIGFTAAEGLILTGQGSTNDVTIKNDADADVLEIPTGTTNVTIVGTLAVGGALAKVAGLETIYVPAAAMYPETTNGCDALTQVELSNGPELKCLDFAAAADDFAQFQVIFPKSWNEGTVTFQAFFTVTGTNTGTVAWGLAGRSFADSADLNTAFGTQVVATAKAHSGTSNDIDVAAVSGAVTIAGAAADTLTIFQIARDVSADSQTGAARLLGIKLFFTTDAANDA